MINAVIFNFEYSDTKYSRYAYIDKRITLSVNFRIPAVNSNPTYFHFSASDLAFLSSWSVLSYTFIVIYERVSDVLDTYRV